MTKMSKQNIELAQVTARMNIRLNSIDPDEGTKMEDALAELVISLVGHIRALEAEAEYEYAIMRSSTSDPGLKVIVGDYWGEREERETQLKNLTKVAVNPVEYRLIKRRRAGEIENV